MSIQNMKHTRITCFGCGKPLSGAKTVIEGQWRCPDCTYLYDHPDAQISPGGRSRRASLQKERLFDPGPAQEKNEYQ